MPSASTLAAVTMRPQHVRSSRTSHLRSGRQSMASRHLSVTASAAALVKAAHAQSETLSSGDPIPLESDLGMTMLDQSHAKRNFIALISNFTTQINGDVLQHR